MQIDLELDKYRSWLENNIFISDPFSPESMRKITLQLIMGKNYRLLTEQNTKKKLFATYAWLIEINQKAINQYGNNWKESLLEEILQERSSSKEEKNLMYWLLGLTEKTAKNLDIKKDDFLDFLRETVIYCNELFESLENNTASEDDVWLLLMAGSATLNIRGSQKSKIGKALERVFLKVALSALGLEFEGNFWLNIASDLEVDRETDAEVQTRRGRIRIEMGLISQGNPEVIADKITRVGERGVVIFDKVGTRSRIYETARHQNVKLIQIRHSQPLVELKRHLEPLVDVELRAIPELESELEALLAELPDEYFVITNP